MTEVRQTHRFGYRSGEWAELLSETEHVRGRRCYVVRFSDGASDFWPVEDPDAGYEFREKQ